jgi:hypothetical protein
MAHEFLERSNIVTAFEQVSGEGMSEGVAIGPFHISKNVLLDLAAWGNFAIASFLNLIFSPVA